MEYADRLDKLMKTLLNLLEKRGIEWLEAKLEEEDAGDAGDCAADGEDETDIPPKPVIYPLKSKKSAGKTAE